MRPLLLSLPLTFVWALAPFFGSPASLWVMPLVAVLAATFTSSTKAAVLASLGSLGLLISAWLLLAATGGDLASFLRQAGVAAAVGATHAPIVAALAAGAGWAARRLRPAARLIRA